MPNRKRIDELMRQSLMLVTALAPRIGYDNAATHRQGRASNGTSLREEALASGLVGAGEFDALVRPEAMLAPGLSCNSIRQPAEVNADEQEDAHQASIDRQRATPKIVRECAESPRSPPRPISTRSRRPKPKIDQPCASRCALCSSHSSFKPAAAMAGSPSRNEKRAASVALEIRNRAAVSVEPDRETPGMSAPDCAMPTIKRVFQRRMSMVRFGRE